MSTASRPLPPPPPPPKNRLDAKKMFKDEKQQKNKELIKKSIDKNYLPNFGKLEVVFANNKIMHITRTDTERIENES